MTVAEDGIATPVGVDAGSAPVPDGGRHPRPRGSWRAWTATAVPAVFLAAAAWNYRWVQEDAFINFRIIGNLLDGNGPVFNVGERVEAYSDPLWVAVLALVHAAPGSPSLAWTSVVLGIALSVAGVLLGGRAVQRLGTGPRTGTVVPIGLYVFVAVAGVWEYVTGGLEMGMVLGWLGLSVWLLVRVLQTRDGAVWAGIVLGLGTLIRPELVLMSAVFLVALLVLASSPAWRGRPTAWRRYVGPLIAAVALPVAYELWRMAYFGLVVSNTALAKSAGSTWWNQGFTYLWNFVAPYTLWVPLLLMIPLVAPRARRWWRRGQRSRTLVLCTPAAAGLVSLVYVVAIGGDYQHARLLLPAFFALCVFAHTDTAQLRGPARYLVAGIAVWVVVCIGWLRFDPSHALFHQVHGIANERDSWVTAVPGGHPIEAGDYGSFTLPARHYRVTAAEARAAGGQVLVISTDAFFPLRGEVVRTASSPLPQHAFVDVIEIGSRGLVAGPDVYVFDTQSLANPIGAHLVVPRGLRPGGKDVPLSWMVGRFGAPGTTVPVTVATPREIAAAAAAVRCGRLGAYLHDITAPLTWSLAFANLTHALANTSMQFSPDPVTAARQLCPHPVARTPTRT